MFQWFPLGSMPLKKKVGLVDSSQGLLTAIKKMQRKPQSLLKKFSKFQCSSIMAENYDALENGFEKNFNILFVRVDSIIVVSFRDFELKKGNEGMMLKIPS